MSHSGRTFTSKDKEKVNARRTVASIIDHLKASRQPLSIHYLSQALGININERFDIKNSLENNDKIEVIGKALRYKVSYSLLCRLFFALHNKCSFQNSDVAIILAQIKKKKKMM